MCTALELCKQNRQRYDAALGLQFTSSSSGGRRTPGAPRRRLQATHCDLQPLHQTRQLCHTCDRGGGGGGGGDKSIRRPARPMRELGYADGGVRAREER